MNLNVIIADSLLTLLLDSLQLTFFLVLGLINLFFCCFLSVDNLVSQLQHLLHQFCVFIGQFFNQNLPVLHLAFEILD